MTKKEGNIKIGALVKNFIKNILTNSLRNIFDSLVEIVKKEIIEIKKKIFEYLVVLLLSVIGLFFILLGGVFLLNQYTRIGYGWSFVTCGVFILLLSLLIKHISKIGKNNEVLKK